MDLDALDLDALMPDTIEGDLEGLQEEAGRRSTTTASPSTTATSTPRSRRRSSVGTVDRGGRWSLLLRGPSAITALEAAGVSSDAIAALVALQPGQGTTSLADDVAMAHVQGGAPPRVAGRRCAGDRGLDRRRRQRTSRTCAARHVGPNARTSASVGVGGVMAGSPGTSTRRLTGSRGAHGANWAPTRSCRRRGRARLVWAAMTEKGAKPVGTRAAGRARRRIARRKDEGRASSVDELIVGARRARRADR